VHLRKTYHFGPAKISMYLKRYHDLGGEHLRRVADPQAPGDEPPAGLPALPPPHRQLEALREAPAWAPLQIDVKFVAPLKGSRKKHCQFTAIDDCTRIRVPRIYDRLNQTTAIRFVDYVVEKLPFAAEVIQTDNGPEFGSQFHYHVLDKGIGHVYIKPATPRLNGKVERSHRIDQEEFYRMPEGVVIDDTELFNDRLQDWEDFYNLHRPHGGLAGQTPYERLREKTTSPV
ncbi:MAG TPA: integrase core domain-containing protein, partial [Actinomycetota bacterium]